MVKSDKKTRGLIIGKFLPFHKGHRYLIDFAKNYVDELFVLVCTLEKEPILGEIRYNWLKKTFPEVNIIHHTSENPQYPEEDPNFWKIWHDSIKALVKDDIDYVFASEDYGFKLAEVLKAQYIPINHARDIVNVSGTRIRENPLKYWDFLPDLVKYYFVKKVCIYGPESTGKTTLAKNLAKHYNTVSVNEYARDFLALKNNQECNYEDIEKIARGHYASEKALYSQANKFIFVDTDIITTSIRSDLLFGKTPDYVKDLINKKDYDLYLLLDIDVPFIEDSQRFFPTKRKWLFDKFEKKLQIMNKNYIIINGTWEERFNKSIKLKWHNFFRNSSLT